MPTQRITHAALRVFTQREITSNATGAVETLARALGWEAGELWLAGDEGALRMAAGWYAEEIDATAIRESGKTLVFRPGQGLPGKAAKNGMVIWVDTIDVSSLARSEELRAAGLVSGLAVPVRAGSRVTGALVFFRKTTERVDQTILDALSEAGSVIGALLDAERTRDELRRTRAKLRLLLDETHGAAWTATKGEIVDLDAVEIGSAEEAEQARERLARVLRENELLAAAHGAAVDGTTNTLRVEGLGRTWSARVAPLDTANGRLAIGVATDVTVVRRYSDVVRRIAGATGPALFETLATELARAMGTEMTIVAAVQSENHATILGSFSDGLPLPQTSYDFRDAPCRDTMQVGDTVIFPAGASSRWSSTFLLQLGIDGYAGHPMIDSRGRAIGVVAAMSRQPLSLGADAVSILRIVAARASAEVERMRLEEEARASEERHRSVAEALEDAVISIDHDGVIESVNGATSRMFGYAREELLGANVSILMPSQHAERHATYIRRYLATGESHVLGIGRDVVGKRKDRSEMLLRLTLQETRLPNKRLFTGILRDLTEIVTTRRMLQRSRAIINDTQRLTHIGNWVWDIDTNALEWSDEIFRIFGRTRDAFEPTYPNFLACIHPEDRKLVEEAVAEALRSGARYSIEHRVIRADGSEASVHERGEVQYENGRPIRMIGTVQDVTERHRSHGRLAVLSRAIEHAADQVMITDREGRIEYVNPAFERVTGYRKDEAIGKTPRILKSGSHTLEFYKNVWQTLLNGHVYRGVFTNRRSDGTPMFEEKTIAPVRNAAGAITHFISTGRDITDRRKAEHEQEALRRALELSVSEWRLTFDAIDFPILVCGRDGKIHRANVAAQKLSGQDFRDLVETSLDALPRSQPWTGALSLFPRAAAGEAASAQGQDPVAQRTWELVAMPFSRGDEVSLVLIIARDLTPLLELQESLRRTEVMSTLGAIVAGVAHEVRNPLFSISATIDAFEGGALDEDRFQAFTSRLRSELSRLTELMRDLLDYGRPADAELHPGTLREPAEAALRVTETLATQLRIELGTHLETNDDPVMIDAHRMHIAIRNLLDNAMRHAGEGGRVCMSIRRVDSDVELVIHDSGPGFAEADIPHLFEPFFTRRRGGTGLGLSIVHRTVEQHGGTIVAENHPAGGAVIRMCLPLAKPDP